MALRNAVESFILKRPNSLLYMILFCYGIVQTTHVASLWLQQNTTLGSRYGPDGSFLFKIVFWTILLCVTLHQFLIYKSFHDLEIGHFEMNSSSKWIDSSKELWLRAFVMLAFLILTGKLGSPTSLDLKNQMRFAAILNIIISALLIFWSLCALGKFHTEFASNKVNQRYLRSVNLVKTFIFGDCVALLFWLIVCFLPSKGWDQIAFMSICILTTHTLFSFT
jgi:hypothetical protein